MKRSALLSMAGVLAALTFSPAGYTMECSYGGIKQLIKDGKFDEAKTSIDQCQENKSEERKAVLKGELAKAKAQAQAQAKTQDQKAATP